MKNLRRPKPLPSQVSPIGEEILWNYSGRSLIKGGQPRLRVWLMYAMRKCRHL